MNDLELKIKNARRDLNGLALLLSGLNTQSGNNVVIGIAEARTQISLILDDLKVDEEAAILSFDLGEMA